MNEKIKRQTRDYVNKDNQAVNENDIKKIIDNEEKLHAQLKKKGPLSRFFTDIKLLMGLLKDYYSGDYRKIPYKSIASIVTALIYVLNPIDIIPDVLPVIGQIDDALVFGLCLKMIEGDLVKYQAWKATQVIK